MLSRLCLQKKHILCSQAHVERSGIVAHQPHCGQNPPHRNERSKHSVLLSNSRHSAFVLGAFGEETSVALERLTPMDTLIFGVFWTLRTHWRFTFAVPM